MPDYHPQHLAELTKLHNRRFLSHSLKPDLKLTTKEEAIYPMTTEIKYMQDATSEAIAVYPSCIIGVLNEHHDERGSLAELYRRDYFPWTSLNIQMGYVSFTNPNVCRGPHEHHAQTDVFFFIRGAFSLELWDNRDLYDVFNPASTYQRFDGLGGHALCFAIIPPGVVHSYTNLSSLQGATINLPDQLYRGKYKQQAVDEIRHEDNPESIFKSRIITHLLVED